MCAQLTRDLFAIAKFLLVLYRYRYTTRSSALFIKSINFVVVCEIFGVKEWRDLENQVRGRSRSMEITPFDRPYATFYWSAIVNIALSCTIFELFDVE